MTDDAPDDPEFQTDYASPKARADEARKAVLDALDRIDPDDPNTTVIDVLEAEEDAVSTWAKHAAKAAEDGHPEGVINAHAKAVSDASEKFTKQDITDLVRDQRGRLRNPASGSGGSGPPRLDDWMENNIQRVVRLETTDRTQDTVWRWDFSEGTVETASTKDGITHFSWSHFRDEIYQGLGVNTAKPDRSEAEEWRMWLADLIDQYEDVRETFGPRSHAVERLQGFVEDSIAFGDKGDAVERNGVHLDADPNNGTPDELRVQSSDVKRIADDVEVTVRALQQELDAQGFTLDHINGVSEGEYVNGNMVRFWILDPEFATPASYMDSAQSPAAKAAASQQNQPQSGSGGGSGGSAPSATGQPGQQHGGGPDADGTQLSSIGPSDDDGDAADGDDTDADDGADGNESAHDGAQERTDGAQDAHDAQNDGEDT